MERQEGMTMKNLLSLAATLGFVSTAGADALPKPVADMECLVGAWKFTGTATMGKDAAKVTATWDCKRTAAKFGVSCTLALKGIPGMPVYAETDLMGYDAGANKYHWFAVTNAGETHDHVAEIPTGNKLQFVYTGTQEGKPLKEVIDFEIGKDEKSLTLRSETFIAGASAMVLEGNARK